MYLICKTTKISFGRFAFYSQTLNLCIFGIYIFTSWKDIYLIFTFNSQPQSERDENTFYFFILILFYNLLFRHFSWENLHSHFRRRASCIKTNLCAKKQHLNRNQQRLLYFSWEPVVNNVYYDMITCKLPCCTQ